jgi:microcystin-dependent protein
MSTTISGNSGVSQVQDGAKQNGMEGEVCWFARSTAPAGFLKANGALVSRTTYAALFTAIGTTFGAGDGSTTFALPDLRGEFVRGWSDGHTVDSGRALGSAQTEMVGPHTHSLAQYGSIGSGVGGSTWIAGSGTNIPNNIGTENRPRNIALLACIRF